MRWLYRGSVRKALIAWAMTWSSDISGASAFSCKNLRLEPLEVEQEFFFELLSRMNASWQEPRVPVWCSVLKRDDERFGEGGFVPSGWGCDSFVAHGEFEGVGISMIFGQGCSSVVGRPWCEL
jgi:hypothetical protein